MGTKPRSLSKADQAATLAKATLRAAKKLDLTDKVLAEIIGVSGSTISRMRSGEYVLEQKPLS